MIARLEKFSRGFRSYSQGKGCAEGRSLILSGSRIETLACTKTQSAVFSMRSSRCFASWPGDSGVKGDEAQSKRLIADHGPGPSGFQTQATAI